MTPVSPFHLTEPPYRPAAAQGSGAQRNAGVPAEGAL